MKIECTVEELKELLEEKTSSKNNKEDVSVDILLCGKKIN